MCILASSEVLYMVAATRPVIEEKMMDWTCFISPTIYYFQSNTQVDLRWLNGKTEKNSGVRHG